MEDQSVIKRFFQVRNPFKSPFCAGQNIELLQVFHIKSVPFYLPVLLFQLFQGFLCLFSVGSRCGTYVPGKENVLGLFCQTTYLLQYVILFFLLLFFPEDQISQMHLRTALGKLFLFYFLFNFFQHILHVIHCQRFQQIIIHPILYSFFSILKFGISAQNNCMYRYFLFIKTSDHLQAVHFRHTDICDHKIRFKTENQVKSFLPIGSLPQNNMVCQ